MSKKRFTGVLNAAQFPLMSVLQGRTIVIPRYDVNFKTQRAFYGTDESANYNIPQLSYCENVMPTAEGLQSVGFIKVIDGIEGSTAFDQAITLRDEDENNFIFSPAGGLNYMYVGNNGAWESLSPISMLTGKLITRAYVNGRSFVCYEGQGVYEYITATNTFEKKTLSGLTDAEVRGIGSSSNYLLAFTDISVAYSSLVDPLDFVPSLTTGAGISTPQDVKGKIQAVLGISGGFVIYTTRNAVGATFTNNVRGPFTYKEIANSGGIDSYEQVTSEQNAGPHYAWTTGGLQKITLQGSEVVSAEVNDFLAGRMYEAFDAVNNRLDAMYASASEFLVKVSYVSSRYLVVSYSPTGSTTYEYALVFDTALKRWGKLKFPHVDCFFYTYPNLFGDLSYEDLGQITYEEFFETRYIDLALGVESDIPSKLAMGFLQADGSVWLAEMNYNKQEQHDAIIIFGKFQLERSRNIGLQKITMEGVYAVGGTTTTDFSLKVLVNWDGYNVAAVETPMLIEASGKFTRYGTRAVGENVCLLLRGTFALTSYMLEATDEGRD